MTKAELLKKTKDELLKIAKRGKAASVGKGNTKAEIAAAILKATKKKSAKKSAKKTVLAKPARGTVLAKTAKKSVKKKTVSKTKVITRDLAKATALQLEKSQIPVIPSSTPHATQGLEETIEDSKYHLAEDQDLLYTDNNIPDRYEDDRVGLLVRDPFHIFAFWDLHPQTIQNKTSEVHADINSIVLRVYDVTDIAFSGANAHKWFDIEANYQFGNWHINVPEDDRAYLVEIGLRDDIGNFHPIARSNTITTPRASVSSRTDENWMIADEDFWKLYAASGGFGSSISSADLTGEMKNLLMKSISSGSGSYHSGAFSEKSELGFELNCELVVYGRSEPDASVTINGDKVSLREDGTFTKRYGLRDGIKIISAQAESADHKKQIKITPTISKSTIEIKETSDE